MKKFITLLAGIILLITMINWFNSSKKYKDISHYSDSWSIAEGKHEGNTMFLRYRKEAKEMAGHPDLPFQIGVAIPLLHPNEQKLPTNEEMEQLNSIEDDLVQTLKKDQSVFDVLVITTNNMREFVFYAKEWKPEYYENQVKEVEKRHREHLLQFIMQEDKKWSNVTSLIP